MSIATETAESIAITFHIRAPMPRKGGNQFYRDKTHRVAKTLCGDSVTEHDIRFSERPLPFGMYVPCERCVDIRMATTGGAA